MVRLTLAHKPDIGLGAIALIVRIENAENTFGHLVGILRASTWWRRKICKVFCQQYSFSRTSSCCTEDRKLSNPKNGERKNRQMNLLQFYIARVVVKSKGAMDWARVR